MMDSHTITYIILLVLAVLCWFCAFKMGQHWAMARVFGSMADTWETMQDVKEVQGAFTFSDRLRDNMKKRGLL